MVSAFMSLIWLASLSRSKGGAIIAADMRPCLASPLHSRANDLIRQTMVTSSAERSQLA
jgi:hypothetical protein